MPRRPLRLASVTVSMSVSARPKTSGAGCTCMSITPAAGLTIAGAGGKPTWARTGEARQAARSGQARRASAFIFSYSSVGLRRQSIGLALRSEQQSGQNVARHDFVQAARYFRRYTMKIIKLAALAAALGFSAT